ncbi:DUF5050 domain-containing protein [Clostridium botulinum]|uniref:Prolow-density lipoprotein receptor-related protein 1-like beta-propeller domain-containing protein n=3 Tax=Clostridium botulinum TaxID=1491 RepID=A0A9Q1UXV4_CLOBO|nr:DUF5050 domain-containing protein [Clostridium botulinum]KLU75773.1 hypothetical protein CBC3_06615 [Clostridium botulinum V891]KOA72681.1 hypothetical protein ADU78_14505 [Clostridium botulinum]KOA77296.1 hypothetical protein ADU77_07820 [Clostridium botulinum]KOA84949.1 hypothetical protein ADU75_08135 [Clostridium botulinum]KOA85788.1 hypothetical protein ADU74_09430 [Clostridium botulinum]
MMKIYKSFIGLVIFTFTIIGFNFKNVQALPQQKKVLLQDILMGNTESIVQKENYIYYIDQNDKSIYRITSDKKVTQRITNKIQCTSLSIQEKDLYFTIDKSIIMKCDLNGKNEKLVLYKRDCISIVKYTPQWIYFIDKSNNTLSKVKTDGSKKIESIVSNVNWNCKPIIENQYIYYVAIQDRKIHRVDLKNMKNEVLVTAQVVDFKMYNECIYYKRLDPNGVVNNKELFKVELNNVENTSSIKINSYYDKFQMYNDNIYLLQQKDYDLCRKQLKNTAFKIAVKDFKQDKIQGVRLDNEYLICDKDKKIWVNKLYDSIYVANDKYGFKETGSKLPINTKIIDIDDKYIYYINSNYSICKMNINGMDNKVIFSGKNEIRSVYSCVSNNEYIYYSYVINNDNKQEVLYKVKKDGTKNQLIKNQGYKGLNILSNGELYQWHEKNNGLFDIKKVEENGQDKILAKDTTTKGYYYDKNIYYFSGTQANILMRTNLDGTQNHKLEALEWIDYTNINSIFFKDNYLYACVPNSNGGTLFRKDIVKNTKITSFINLNEKNIIGIDDRFVYSADLVCDFNKKFVSITKHDITTGEDYKIDTIINGNINSQSIIGVMNNRFYYKKVYQQIKCL